MYVDSPALTRLAVLKAIRTHGPISRVELAATVGLAGSTVTQITADLMQRRLLSEERRAPEGKGRPRVLLSIDPHAGAVLGASLGVRGELEVCLVDLGGDLLTRASYALGTHTRVDDLARHIGAQLETFIDVNAIERSLIWSVAVALPATIQNPEGVVHWLPTLQSDSTPARQILSDALGLPVTIENDIDCLARAEYWFGPKILGPNFTLLEIGLAVGIAEYVGGVPRIGANGLSSEFAHLKSAWGDDARLCFCGARGCLTTYASTAGIVRSGRFGADVLAMNPDDSQDFFRQMAEAATAGNKSACAAFRLSGTHLGIALSNLINIRDPGTVLVRYTDPDIPDLLSECLMAVVDESSLATVRERTHIDLGFAQEGWRWKGAAALALEQAYLG